MDLSFSNPLTTLGRDLTVTTPPDITYPRRVRSFVKREGRMSPSHQRAWDDLWLRYGVEYTPEPIDLTTLFGREAPCIVDIGFGNGQSLLALAVRHPEFNFLGIEMHRPGIGALLFQAAQLNLTNIRVYCADAVHVLTECIPHHSLAAVLLFFPDPWPKLRHHKRRLVQAPFANIVAQKLKTGGCWHLATDWEDYANQMQQVLTAHPCFSDNDLTPMFDQRPVTKYHERGQRLGHGIWDFTFKTLSLRLSS